MKRITLTEAGENRMDIVERLNDMDNRSLLDNFNDMDEAADTIESLRQQLEDATQAFDICQQEHGRMSRQLVEKDATLVAVQDQVEAWLKDNSEKVAGLEQQLATFKNAYSEQIELHNLTLDELADKTDALGEFKDEIVFLNRELLTVTKRLAESQAREKVLRDAAGQALEQMCLAIAPSNLYIDTVDKLDAALAMLSAAPKIKS
jgi:chromosome segregation ATPase